MQSVMSQFVPTFKGPCGFGSDDKRRFRRRKLAVLIEALEGRCLLASSPWIVGQTPGTIRNNFGGWLGTRITVGSSAVTIDQLGRWVVSGNSQSHQLKLVNSTTNVDVSGSAITVNTSGATPGQYLYGALAAPVTLSAGGSYYLVSQENYGGDSWYDSNTTVTPTSAASVAGSVYYANNQWNAGGGANVTFGPLNMMIVSGVNQAPTIASPAAANPTPVTGISTDLSVLGADDGGEAALSYTWSVSSKPAGAAAPIFSANATNAAKNATVTFSKLGSYTFLATIKDSGGLSVTSSVNVNVVQTFTKIDITPGLVHLVNGASQQFTAVAKDQFGATMPSQPGFTWNITSGAGSISAAGTYIAPASGEWFATIRATSGSIVGVASVNDAFDSVIEDMDNNQAPPTTPANLVNIKDGAAIWKTVTGGQETVDGVDVRHFTFRSEPAYKDGVFHDDTQVYAVMATPAGATPTSKYPAVLLLHGGGGTAQDKAFYNRVINWAKAGYVAIACDLPSITGDTADVSSGTWRTVAYNQLVYYTYATTPSIKASWLYVGVATAIKAFTLLKTNPNVDASRIGITGASWGGYTTTMVNGLLGDRVKAGFSLYGSGFYDEDSAFRSSIYPTQSWHPLYNNPTGRETWLRYLDAGRRAGGIGSNFFLDAAADDYFFRPPAVEKTLFAINNSASLNFQFSPNDNHRITDPGGNTSPDRSMTEMEEPFFDYWMKGIGGPLPVIMVEGTPTLDGSNNLNISFSITADPYYTLQAPKLYYSFSGPAWNHAFNQQSGGRSWIALSTATQTGTIGQKRTYSITVPSSIASQGIDWYLLVSDTSAAHSLSVSTHIYQGTGTLFDAVTSPSITQQPADLTSAAGQTATFSVTAGGDGPLVYQWKRGTTLLGGNLRTLTIPNVQAADTGTYTCTVSNSAGSVVTNSVQLAIAPPAVIRQPSDQQRRRRSAKHDQKSESYLRSAGAVVRRRNDAGRAWEIDCIQRRHRSATWHLVGRPCIDLQRRRHRRPIFARWRLYPHGQRRLRPRRFRPDPHRRQSTLSISSSLRR